MKRVQTASNYVTGENDTQQLEQYEMTFTTGAVTKNTLSYSWQESLPFCLLTRLIGTVGS